MLNKTNFITFTFICLFTSSNAQAINLENEPVQPIDDHINLDKRKVDLGNLLFHDPSLSSNGKVSCASCHSLDKGGTDNLTKSLGVSGKEGATNSPTVFNIGDHFMFFWDGRAKSLSEQMDGPIHHPDEMANTWENVVKTVNQNQEYKKEFIEIYQSSPTEETIKDVIVTFQQSLITPNSPFDLYLKGDENAISDLAKNGYELFKSHGCASCHQGKNLGGNMLQKFGIIGNYFEERGAKITEADLGRYNITNDPWDKHVFKVPSLRNIALTAPYFHDGTANTLEEAVEIMAKYQLGKELSKEERNAIIEFLKSLTGEYKGEMLE